MHSSFEPSRQLAAQAYKTASATYVSEPSRLAEARRLMMKTADFGENANPQFEKAFGAIASTYLQEKAPGLMQYVVGFQLLDRAEKGKKAVGAFTAKLGNRVIDIPMFFINGELKGHYFMRLRRPEMFLPLRESFLDYLFSKLPQDTGEAAGSISSTDPTRATPNIQPFSGSRFMKGAAEHIHGWAEEEGLLEAYHDMRLSPRLLKIGTELKHNRRLPGINLLEILGESESLLKSAAQLADRYPTFAKAMAKHHGGDWMQKAAANVLATRVSSPLIHAPFRRTLPSLLPRRKAAAFAASLVYRDKLSSFVDAETADARRAEIERFGSYAIDNRDANKLAMAYRVEEGAIRFEPPNAPGVYRVTFLGNETRDAVVFPGAYRIDGSQDLVIDKQNKKYAFGDRESYIVSAAARAEEDAVQALASSMPSNARPELNEVFVAVMPNGYVAGPYRVTERITKDSFKIERVGYSGFSSSTQKYIEFRPAGLGGRVIGDTLVMPMDTKVWPLGKVQPDESGYVSYTKEEEFEAELAPKSQIELAELQKYANLTLRVHRGGTVEFNHAAVNMPTARRLLLEKCCLAKAAADRMLAEVGTTQRYIVSRPGEALTLDFEKTAARNFTPSLDFPQTAEPYASESGRYMIEQPEQQFSVAEPEPRRRELEPYEDVPGQFSTDGGGGSVNGVSPSDVIAADEVSSLFDLSGLVSIVRNSRIDTQVRRTTQALLRCVDELGSALFVFYAHYEEFEDMYGEESMDDLESAMISIFEGAGDLFITLSRRSADPHPELDISDLPAQ